MGQKIRGTPGTIARFDEMPARMTGVQVNLRYMGLITMGLIQTSKRFLINVWENALVIASA